MLAESSTPIPPRRRWLRRGIALLGIAFLGLNALAYFHAYRMTHFVDSGERPATPLERSTSQKIAALLFGVEVPKPANSSNPSDWGYAFETLTFRAADDVELEGWWIPLEDARGTTVLVHGYAAAKASLRGEANFFLERNWNVLLLDCRGSGGSEGHRTSLGWYEALDVQAAVSEARDRAPQKPVLAFGMSMGASATLRAVGEDGLDLDALIVEAPFGRLSDTTRRRFGQMGVPAFPAAELLLFWGGVQAEFSAFEHDPEDYVSTIRCPGLILFGAEDPHIPREDVETLIANLGERMRHEFLPGGHSPLLRAVPDAWTQRVDAFLTETFPR